MIKLSLSLPLEALVACRFASDATNKVTTGDFNNYEHRQRTDFVGIRRKVVGPKKVEFHLYATDGHRLVAGAER